MHSAPPFAPAPPANAHLLSEAQLACQQRLETLGLLTQGVAHDFNNLLTGVIGHLEVAESLLSPTHPARSELARVHGAANRAAKLAQQLLTFGRADDAAAHVDLATLLPELLPLLRSSLPRSTEVRTELAGRPGTVHLSPSQLQQILFTLVFKASQALGGAAGVISLTVSRCRGEEAPEVEPGQLTRGQSYVCLSVSDTGSEMVGAVGTRGVDAFFTLGARGIAPSLDLALVRTIVLQHQGAMTQLSVPSEGTLFRVYLPESRPPLSERAARPEAGSSGRTSDAHIAIIDDEETVVRLAKQALEFAGYRTTALESPESCIAHVRQGGAFDLIITDHRMPSMSGLELSQALRAAGSTVPVLITSGSLTAVTPRDLEAVAPAQFIAKPFTLVGLLEAVGKLIAENSRPGVD